MRVRKFSEVEKNFTKIANEVLHDHLPTIITNSSKESLVMISLEDFRSHEETFYLTRNPVNRKRLMTSVKNVKNKKYQHHNLTLNEADQL